MTEGRALGLGPSCASLRAPCRSSAKTRQPRAGSRCGARSLRSSTALCHRETGAQLGAHRRALRELADSQQVRADSQQERAEIQQERIDLAARELAEISDRLQAAANALRESI